MNERPLVTALTLNWNRPVETLECLQTLAEQTYSPLQLLVVDNGSSDDSVERIKSRFPHVDLLASHQNLGFAAGANLGLRRALKAGSDLIFLLNNDTTVEPDTLLYLIDQMQPGVGIVAPLIYYADPPSRIWSAGGSLHPILLEQYGDRRGEADTRRWLEPLDRDFVTGCGMLLSRELLSKVGLFDERFFMYYEDFDLCLRARREGFRIVLEPAARMWHRVSLSSKGSNSPQERYWMARSSAIFFRKHARGVQWLAILPWRIGSALRTTLRLLWARRIDACAAYWRGLRDGWQVS
jgi:GT2 family glycosyltransferase